MCNKIQQPAMNTQDDEVEKVIHPTRRIFELGDEVFEKVENVMNAFFSNECLGEYRHVVQEVCICIYILYIYIYYFFQFLVLPMIFFRYLRLCIH